MQKRLRYGLSYDFDQNDLKLIKFYQIYLMKLNYWFKHHNSIGLM